MTLDDVLDDLEHVPSPSDVSPLDRRRLERLCVGPLDPHQLARLRRVAPDLAQGREPWVPGIGESFVLTWSAAGGEVARLRVERKGEPGVLDTTGLGPDAARQVRLAHQVLHRLAAERRRGAPDLGALGHVVSCSGSTPLDGASLGVSAAVAFLSSWLGRPPRDDLAATACVDGAGTLRPVEHVADKLAALVQERPHLRLLVASTQAEHDPLLVRHELLRDALTDFALQLDDLPASRSTRDRRTHELQALNQAQSESYSTERWLDFVDRALALADDPDCEPEARTMAYGHAMLFALHAGDPKRAAELGAHITDADLPNLGDAERAWIYVARASAAIDDECFDHAIELAETAVEQVHLLRAIRDRREVVGRAFGTLGRALTHAGRDEDAHAWLEKGAEHHREYLPEDLPRSLCYLATCLRRLGRYEDAAGVLHDAFAALRDRDALTSHATTRFLLYERARLHFEREAFEACLDDIETLQRRQPSPTDYPRLGTLRYEVACRALLGDLARAEELRVLAAMSCEATPPGPLRRLAEAVAEVSLTDPFGSRERWDPVDLVY